MTSERAWHLRELLIALNSALPGIAFGLKAEARAAAERRMQWRARRPQFPPARGDRPPLTAEERRARNQRNRRVAADLAAGVPIAELARHHGVQPRTLLKWARKGAGRRAGDPATESGEGAASAPR